MMQQGIFYDLANFFIVLIFALFIIRKNKLQPFVSILIVAHAVLPYVLNDVLFPWQYLGDQGRYFNAVLAIRDGDWLGGGEQGTVLYASRFLAFIPLPFVLTIKSLGFFNTFLFLWLFHFLYRRGFLSLENALFYLIYPSFALYTGLSLRDTLILFFMVMSLYFVMKGHRLFSLLLTVPLIYIKGQNFLIMGPFIFLYGILGGQGGISRKQLFVTIGLTVSLAVITAPLWFNELNHFRAAMFVEDGGTFYEALLLQSTDQVFSQGIFAAFYMLFKPFPWDAGSAFQLIQSFENIILLWFLAKVTIDAYRKDKYHTLFWLFFLLTAMTVYGLVVFNFGTAARYRYPLLIVYYFAIASNIRSRQATDAPLIGQTR